MRTGSGAGVLRLLFKDRISSTVHVTDGAGNQVASTGYFPFGATMRSTGTMPTDHLFTDQQQDGSGLYNYGARYYDPQLGHFISPDTIVPDPTNVVDYQRYLYARGNPLKYNDPKGHCALSVVAGPAGLAVDAPCWSSGAGEAAVAAAGAGLVVSAASVPIVLWALDDPLPDYPAPETIGDFDTVGESFPLPGATTVTIDGVPLGGLDLNVGGATQNESLLDPSTGAIISDPLNRPVTGANIYDATLLRRNMIRAGQIPPTGADAHHIVARLDSRSAIARSILKNAGIDIDDPVNGVFLPSRLSSPNLQGSAIHGNLHSSAYYAELENRLLANPSSVQAVLDQIRQELLDDTFPY